MPQRAIENINQWPELLSHYNGFGIDKGDYNNPAEIAALRVNEWSSLWGIRQFQQFGGPPVSIWHDLPVSFSTHQETRYLS